MQAEKIFFVVPTYNDFSKLPAICQAIIEKGYVCVVVDDGSKMKENQNQLIQNIYYLRHEDNLGQGAALQTGMNFAILKGASIIVHFDADGQHTLDDALKMIVFLNEKKLDIVLGSRFLTSESNISIPFRRKFTLKTARLFNNYFTSVQLSDVHNGLRVMNKETAQLIDLKQNRMAHATEIIQLIKKYHFKFAEFHTHILYSTDNYKYKGFFYILSIIWDLVYAKIYEKKYLIETAIFILINIFSWFFFESFISKLFLFSANILLVILALGYRISKQKLLQKTWIIRQKTIQNFVKVE